MNQSPSRGNLRIHPPDREHRISIPTTPEAARAAEPRFKQRAIDAYRRFEAAKREFLTARGELAVVQAVIKGEYGPYPVHYRESSLDDWATA